MTKLPHILVVDDHREIRNAVARYLQENGMRASCAKDTMEMDALLETAKVDLIVLDLMMPGEDGLSACRRLSRNGQIPVLLLTALGDDESRIAGFDVGADDYLAKPFNPRELLARIRAILRRTEANAFPAGRFAGARLGFAHWVLDCDRRTLVNEDGQETGLTGSEFKLLLTLLEHNRQIMSRDQLMELTTGRTGAPADRTIDNQISRLRRKLEKDPLRPRIITTVRNGGYCLSTMLVILDE